MFAKECKQDVFSFSPVSWFLYYCLYCLQFSSYLHLFIFTKWCDNKWKTTIRGYIGYRNVMARYQLNSFTFLEGCPFNSMGCINTQTRPVAMGRQNEMLRVGRLQQHITGPCSSSPGCHKVAYRKVKFDSLSNISYFQWLTKFVTLFQSIFFAGPIYWMHC